MIGHLGRYQIIDELARGAMGIVYKAYDPLIERFVAIKTINLLVLPEIENEQFKSNFYQEAKAAGHLNHPNIVTIHDVGKSDDIAYIAMELMEGRELQAILDNKTRLSLEEILNIAIQAATGLHYAHQRGIVHRDVKPSNIMLLGGNHVKLADFGIAMMSTSLSLTNEGSIIGSPTYMSPEQVKDHEIDARSDIFSLGVVVYQMLTGRLPFFGDDVNSVMHHIVNETHEKPSALKPEIPEALDMIVAKCLAKKPDDRYLNANELANALSHFRDELFHARESGINNPLTIGSRFKTLKRLATPWGISQHSVVISSFAALTMIFVLDLITDDIQLHLLYLFPLVMIAFHSVQKSVVKTAVGVSLMFQGLTLAFENLPLYSKLTLAVLVTLTNILVVYISLIVRAYFLEVTKLSSFDGLTGLRNRISFESIIEMEISKEVRSGGVLSFAVINFDNLKEWNESKGYASGDSALKLLANILQENIRQTDTAARISGDEFAILMPHTDAAECESFSKKLSEIISFQMKNASIAVTASIGHATFSQPPASISEVFQKAENAMHAEQSSGLACIL